MTSTVEPRQDCWPETVACAICLVVSWNYIDYGGGTEFSGGTVTGKLAPLMLAGFVLLAIGLVATFTARRLALAAVLGATACQAPLYAFLLAPGVFQETVGGVWSVPAPAAFAWEPGASLGVAALLLTDALHLGRAFHRGAGSRGTSGSDRR